jgi:hypothetical protein
MAQDIRMHGETDPAWVAEEHALGSWAQPLLAAPALARLHRVTFLGGLSSKYTDSAIIDDGTRRDHSVGVAWLALRAAERLNLSDSTKRLAVAWGLTHDIATWSLSHTSEPAFCASTSTDQRTLRRFIVTGHRGLAETVVVARALRETGVDPGDLLDLFEKKRVPANAEHALLWQVIHSPMSPDGLEGIWRAGRAAAVDVPHPKTLIEVLDRDLFEPQVHAAGVRHLFLFWRAKARVYGEFINSDRSRWFESQWAETIRKSFRRLGLMRSLEITEPELVRNAPPPIQDQLAFRWGELRFREPLQYTTEREPRGELAMTLATLKLYLQRRPAVP